MVHVLILYEKGKEIYILYNTMHKFCITGFNLYQHQNTLTNQLVVGQAPYAYNSGSQNVGMSNYMQSNHLPPAQTFIGKNLLLLIIS